MFKELDTVVLTHDIEKYGLEEGDVGAIVHAYNGKAYEVEFVKADGETLAVLTLADQDIRTMETREILHVREISHMAP